MFDSEFGSGDKGYIYIYNYIYCIGSVRFPGPPDLGSLVKCYNVYIYIFVCDPNSRFLAQKEI